MRYVQQQQARGRKNNKPLCEIDVHFTDVRLSFDLLFQVVA